MTMKNARNSSYKQAKRQTKSDRLEFVHKNSKNIADTENLGKIAEDRYFTFELLDPNRLQDFYIAKLSYKSVFDAMAILMKHYPEMPLVEKLEAMLETVAVSPTSILFDETGDVTDIYYAILELVQSLCRGFFRSQEDMLDMVIDERRFASRKSMISQYDDAVHVFAQLLFIFGKARRDKNSILVYADFMNDEILSGI